MSRGMTRLGFGGRLGHVTRLIHGGGGNGSSPLTEIRRRGIHVREWGRSSARLATVTGGAPKASCIHETRRDITPDTRPRPTPVPRSTLKEIVTSWNRASSSAHTHTHTHHPLFSFSPHDTAGFPSSIAVSQEITQGSGGTSRCLPLWRL